MSNYSIPGLNSQWRWRWQDSIIKLPSYQPVIVVQIGSLTVTLPEAPIDPHKVYSYNGKTFGQPLFRLKATEPPIDDIWFEVTEENKLVLKMILEVYREEANVYPIPFRNINLQLSFRSKKENKTVVLPLQIEQKIPQKPVNLLYDLHATVEIPDAYYSKENPDQSEIYRAFTVPEEAAKLDITADIWWQKPLENQTPEPEFKENCIKFDYKKLALKGNSILWPDRRIFIAFRSNEDARKGWNIIRHYKFDSVCYIGKFQYFLVKGNSPFGRFEGEDALKLDPDKLSVKYINGDWKIVEGTSRWAFSFGKNRTHAEKALKVIKKYGFTYSCFVGRPNPPMKYLRRDFVFSPILIPSVKPPVIFPGKIGTRSTRDLDSSEDSETSTSAFENDSNESSVATFSASSGGANKIDLHSGLLFNYPSDHAIFAKVFGNFEREELKWNSFSPENVGNEGYMVHYRKGNGTGIYFMLPTEFRLKTTEEGIPDIRIWMYNKNKDIPNSQPDYRYRLTIKIQPYFNPKAKKDLVDRLHQESGEEKYVYPNNILLGGYSSAKFEVNPAFADFNAELAGEVTETLNNIDVGNGFDIILDTNLESFQYFKTEVASGFNIGKITFMLEEETDGEISEVAAEIPVELDLRLLSNPQLSFKQESRRVFIDIGGNQIKFDQPNGFTVSNSMPFDLEIGGVELTLMHQLPNGSIENAEPYLFPEFQDWPIRIQGNGVEERKFELDEDNLDASLNDKEILNTLQIEPFSVRALIDKDIVLQRIMDLATGELEEWELVVRCRFFENWNNYSDEEKKDWPQSVRVILKDMEGNLIQGGPFELYPNKTALPVHDSNNPGRIIVKMSQNLGQLVRTAKGVNRAYKYQFIEYHKFEDLSGQEQLSTEIESNFLDVNFLPKP